MRRAKEDLLQKCETHASKSQGTIELARVGLEDLKKKHRNIRNSQHDKETKEEHMNPKADIMEKQLNSRIKKLISSMKIEPNYVEKFHMKENSECNEKKQKKIENISANEHVENIFEGNDTSDTSNEEQFQRLISEEYENISKKVQNMEELVKSYGNGEKDVPKTWTYIFRQLRGFIPKDEKTTRRKLRKSLFKAKEKN